MALLARKTDKLPLNQDLQLVSPHLVEARLPHSPDRWLTNVLLTQYQTTFRPDQDRISKHFSPQHCRFAP